MSRATTEEGIASSDFPTFTTGDVLLLFSPTHRYRLHASTLRSSSTYFRELLEDRWRSLDNASRAAPQAGMNKMKLIFDPPQFMIPSGDRKDYGGFGVQICRRNENIQNGAVSRLRGSGAVRNLQTLLKQFENVLRSFYQQPLIMTKSSVMNVLYQDILSLADVAQAMGALGTVGVSLDASLMNQKQEFFQSIADNPGSWGELGMRVQSEVIVREATCHLAGVWNKAHLRNNVEKNCNPALTNLVWKKWRELEVMRMAAEMRIMGFYPETILPKGSEGATANVTTGSRTLRGQGSSTRLGAHSKNMVDWMAINLFRHWTGQTMAAGWSRQAADGGFAFYTRLEQAGEAYIDQRAREKFVALFPLSAKARTSFDAALGRIKEEIKRYLKDIMQVKCSLDTKQCPVKWLTCTETATEEMPWKQQTTTTTTNVQGVASTQINAHQQHQSNVPPTAENFGPSQGPGLGLKRGLNEDQAEQRQLRSAAARDDPAEGKTPDKVVEKNLGAEKGKHPPGQAQGLSSGVAEPVASGEEDMGDSPDDEYGEGLAGESGDEHGSDGDTIDEDEEWLASAREASMR